MPGHYIHMSSMRHTRDRLAAGYRPPRSDLVAPAAAGVTPEEMARLLRDHSNYASIGAIGPDLFFFLPDFRDLSIGGERVNLSSVLVGVLDFLVDMYDMLDPFVTKYENYLGPLSENKEEEISRLTGGLSEAVNNVIGELSTILTTIVERLATHQIDFFTFFSLGFNKGYDNKAFLWSDMLHYRKTGQFGQALWDGAATSDDEGVRAYALGYLTHIATDVTGHAMVNAIAGGPFRLHWQRHHLVENHLDSLWCLNDPLKPGMPGQYGQMTESALYYDIAFGPDNKPVARPPYPAGDSLRDRYVRRRTLDIDSDLPDAIAELLVQAMENVYYVDGELHPQILRDDDGKPNVELIQQTYALLFRFLKYTTTDGFGHERPMPPDVFPNLDFPQWNDPGADSAPGDDDGDSSFWDDVLDFFLAVVKAIEYAADVAEWLATLPWAALADVATYPLRVGIYYALELPLWHMFKAVRAALVMTGYLVPMDDEIASSVTRVGFPDQAAFDEVKTLMDDVFGGLAEADMEDARTTWRDPAYPRLNGDGEFRSPWNYPLTTSELPALLTDAGSLEVNRRPTGDHERLTHLVTASPHERGADVMTLFAMVLGDPGLRDEFETAQTPGEADAVGLKVTPENHLGDSVSFSEYLCWLATRNRKQRNAPPPLVDWNLDADRGYGYHCWDWNRDIEATQPDPEGLDFASPCRPPSQADGFDPNQPVFLHWDDQPDPHCDIDASMHVMVDPPKEG